MSKREQQVYTAILDYFRKNPDAGDTLEGIAKWWLDLELIEVSMNELARILENLVEQQILKIEHQSNGTILYKLNKEMGKIEK